MLGSNKKGSGQAARKAKSCLRVNESRQHYGSALLSICRRSRVRAGCNSARTFVAGHVFAKAIRWGAATVNPVRTLERMPIRRRTRYVTDAEYAAVYALACERIQIAMELALDTGQRRGDLLNLTRALLTNDVSAQDAARETFALENIGQPSKYRTAAN
jgi:integrase